MAGNDKSSSDETSSSSSSSSSSEDGDEDEEIPIPLSLQLINARNAGDAAQVARREAAAKKAEPVEACEAEETVAIVNATSKLPQLMYKP